MNQITITGYENFSLIQSDSEKQVYQAYTADTKKCVIVKVFTYINNACYNLNIRNTCRMIMNISNLIPRYCPRIHSIYSGKSYCALIMDKVNGLTLEAFQRKLLTIEEKEKVIDSLISAVSALHSSGYVHGDLNSRNIIVNEKNNVKLIDLDEFDTLRHDIKLNLDRLYVKCHIITMMFETEHNMEFIINSFSNYKVEDMIDYSANPALANKIFNKFLSIPYIPLDDF